MVVAVGVLGRGGVLSLEATVLWFVACCCCQARSREGPVQGKAAVVTAGWI